MHLPELEVEGLQRPGSPGEAPATGRRFRTLVVIDTSTREALSIEMETSLPGTRDVRVPERLLRERSHPTEIVLDNGPEPVSRVIDQRPGDQGIKLSFTKPDKPERHAVMETFDGRFRDECLNGHCIAILSDARQIIETQRLDYNQVRPYSSLNYHMPLDVYRQFTGKFTTVEAAGLSQ